MPCGISRLLKPESHFLFNIILYFCLLGIWKGMKNEDLFDIGKDIERISEEKLKFYFENISL